MRVASSGVLATVIALSGGASVAQAETDCVFQTQGQTLRLTANCQTDETLTIPDGFTLDGRGRTITAVDPVGGHFVGAVVRNAGATASVRNLTVEADALSNVCDPATPVDQRLRGILLQGASGSITNSRVRGVQQVGSGCQEGFGIEARNTIGHPETQVEISNNRVEGYQKTGILVSGAVDAVVERNRVEGLGATGTIAQNGIQLGSGARGEISRNRVEGSVYTGVETFATGILVIQAGGDVTVSDNQVDDSDGGIVISASDGVLVSDNRVDDAVRYGILVQANAGVLLDNRVRDSAGIGLYVAGEANTAEDNNVRDSLELDIFNEGDNDYFDNVCDTSSGPPVDCGVTTVMAELEGM